MFKIPITYIGYDGRERTKDFYFNLTRAEITKIHLSLPGGLDGFIESLEDNPEIDDVVSVFERLILTSYGKRTANNAFIKSKELSQEFAATDAYSELFLKFIDNENDFVNTFLENVITAPPGALQKIFNERRASEDGSIEKTDDETVKESEIEKPELPVEI